MSVQWHMTMAALLCARVAMAQSRTSPKPRGRPAALLIGWKPNGESPTADSDTASVEAMQRSGLVTVREIASVTGTAIAVNQTERADPYVTLWISIDSSGAVKAQRFHHLIVPRKDHFWQVGANVDSVSEGESTAEETRFWSAPVSQRPALGTLDVNAVTSCTSRVVNREISYVGRSYLGYSEHGEDLCAHYGEGDYLGVLQFDSLLAANMKGREPTPVGLEALGGNALGAHRRLRRAAGRWRSECGDSGFAGRTSDWTIRHRRDRWEAVAMFYGRGGGVCDRLAVQRVLNVPLPHEFVAPQLRSPVSWAQVAKQFQGASDVSVSPDGHWVIVMTPTQAIVTIVDGAKLRSVGLPIELSAGRPVMLEWASGADASRWSSALSALRQ